jgi:hypothetical protein
MPALDFPANPVDQQQYTLNGIVYYYNAAIGAWLTVLSSKVTDTSSNTQVLFNDAGYSNGSPGLVFNKSANGLYANAVTANTVVITRSLTVANFIEFDANITANYSFTSGKNALSAGPVSIANGVFVTIPDGSYWSVT